MTDLVLDAEKLKTVRKARKIGRPKLAKLAGTTERQIARLETSGAAHGQVSDAMMDRIAAALQVPLGALTGHLDLVDGDLVPASETKCTSGCCG